MPNLKRQRSLPITGFPWVGTGRLAIATVEIRFLHRVLYLEESDTVLRFDREGEALFVCWHLETVKYGD